MPMYKTAFVDTGFLIRLLDENHPQHGSAVSYYDYLLEKGYIIRVSTIVIAEYCVKGEYNDLPTANILPSPFNPMHAVKAGAFGKILYEAKTQWVQEKGERTLLKNDVKIMAHAEADKADWYITFDTDSKKLYDTLKQRGMIKFRFIDANQPVSVYTGEIPLEFDEDAHT